MEEIRKTETDNAPDYKYNPKMSKPSSNKLKHKIQHFDWTILLIRQFIWMQISWVAKKLFKNQFAANKNYKNKKRQEQIPKALIFLKGFN